MKGSLIVKLFGKRRVRKAIGETIKMDLDINGLSIDMIRFKIEHYEIIWSMLLTLPNEERLGCC